MLEVKNLTVSYASQSVLRDLFVCFKKGELTSVIGVNGSGKSTLLKSILGIVSSGGGEVFADGVNTFSMKKKERAQKISYLAQSKNVPEMTVEQMVLHGRFPYLSYPRRYSEKDRTIAAWAMEKTEIAHLAQKPMTALSGGMRQRAYLAMVLAQESDYILLDEPTSFLDVNHQIKCMKLLRELAKEGKGIVCVMHDLPLAFDFSDRIALLDRGRIVRVSSPEELCKSFDLQRVFGVSLDQSATNGNYSYRF